MTDDLLERASAALREETADPSEGARFTRARVLASLQQSQVRRRSRLAVLLPLAACFAAASAFGMVDGRVPAFVRSVSHSLGFGHAPAEQAPTPPQRKAPARPAAAVAPPAAAAPVEVPLDAPPERAQPAAAPPPEPEVRAPAPRPASTPRSATLAAGAAVKAEPPSKAVASAETQPSATAPLSDVSDRAHELYRVAHHAHFVDHDFVSALRAWDAYLEAAPSGRFVLEARYNRALCLVRVGRTSEARAALAPFASGQFAGYRQAEASALIDAMNQ